MPSRIRQSDFAYAIAISPASDDSGRPVWLVVKRGVDPKTGQYADEEISRHYREQEADARAIEMALELGGQWAAENGEEAKPGVSGGNKKPKTASMKSKLAAFMGVTR